MSLNLISLSVSALSFLKPRCLSTEETITVRLVFNKNKITKVNIRLMTVSAQLQFFFDFNHLSHNEKDHMYTLYLYCAYVFGNQMIIMLMGFKI